MIKISNQCCFSAGGAFKLEGWLKISSAPAGTVFSVVADKNHNDSGHPGWAVQVRANTGPLEFRFGSDTDPDAVSVATSASVLDGKWHHFAAVNTVSSMLLYLDGVLASQGVTPHMPDTTTGSLLVGASASASGSPQGFFKGNLDELSYYSSALDPSSLAAITHAGSAGKCRVKPIGF